VRLNQFRSMEADRLSIDAHAAWSLVREAYVSSSDSLITMEFALPQVVIGIVGIVVAGETRPLEPEAKPSFWRRLWRALGGK
jgi:ABC-type sulfate transport system permease component